MIERDVAELSWPHAAIAHIRLTRGEEHNILTPDLLQTLDRLLGDVAKNGARALVLTGSGRTFCGGADLKLFSEASSRLHRNPRAVRDDYVLPVISVFRRLREAPFATVAAINGFALGGGCELALSCDFRLMAEESRIGLPEVRLGVVAGAGGVQSITRLVGRAKALEIALLGDQLTAQAALSAGLVTAVHPREQLDEAAFLFAKRLLQCSPMAVAETKRALYRCEAAGCDEADRIALDAVLAAASGAEWWEGTAAFIERRTPDFRKD